MQLAREPRRVHSSVRKFIDHAGAIVSRRRDFPELRFYGGVQQHPRRRKLARSPGWKRSERLEAIHLVVVYLLVRMDLKSQRVGVCESRDRCWGVSEKTIVRATGLSRWRVNRALGDLVWAGYISSHQPREEWAPDHWRGWAAVRKFLPRFWDRIGCKMKLAAAAKKASDETKAAAAAAPPAEPPANPAVREMVRDLADARAVPTETPWIRAGRTARPPPVP